MGSTVQTPFPVLIGHLRTILAEEKRVLWLLTDDAAVRPQVAEHYAQTTVKMAARVKWTEELVTLVEALLPAESQVRAIAHKEIIPAVIGYDRPGLRDQLLEQGRGIIVAVRVDNDEGSHVRVDIDGDDARRTQYCTVAREQIVGVERR